MTVLFPAMAMARHIQFVSREGRFMDEQIIIQMLDEEIAKLEQARDLLNVNGKVVASTKKTAVRKQVGRKPKKRVMSAEARKRIGDAQRKRWAKAKRAKKAAPAKVKKATKRAAQAKGKKAVSVKTANTKASPKSEAPKTEAVQV
jgi:hypothetical protein